MGWLGDAWNAAVTVVQGAGALIRDTAEAADALISGAVDAVTGAVDAGTDALKGLIDGSGLPDWAKEGLDSSLDLIDAGVGAVGVGVKAVTHVVAAGVETFGAIVQGDWGAIPGIWGNVGTQISKDAKHFAEQTADYRIGSSADARPVPGTKGRSVVSAFSVASSATTNTDTAIRDTGKRYEFKLLEGIVRFREGADPCHDTLSAFITPSGHALPQQRDFHGRRLPPMTNAPDFEMIAADGDRIFAKAAGVDDYYFTMMDETFLGTGDPTIPALYSKLDPERNTRTARKADLSVPISGPNGTPPPWTQAQAERLPLYAAVLDSFLTGQIFVRVVPRAWHRLDLRPPMNAIDPPLGTDYSHDLKDGLVAAFGRANFSQPTYKHVTYTAGSLGGQLLFSPVEKRSYDYDLVLSIGVGSASMFETWRRNYGGEIQTQLTQHAFNLYRDAILYQAMNGPIHDGDGYVDGTYIYYLLVRFRNPAAPAGDFPFQRFGILWCDENAYFSGRWRLLDPRDNLPIVFDADTGQTNPSLHGAMGSKTNPQAYRFDFEKYWDPFVAGFVGPDSRMAVSRQVLLMTGNDPVTGANEIYSINTSWGSMDRSWRWRRMPEATVHAGSFLGDLGDKPVVDPQSIRLRGDMTIMMDGHIPTGHVPAIPGEYLPGVWFQKYLPADCTHVPGADNLTRNAKPGSGYSHPWQFLGYPACELADKFPHFLIYSGIEDVDSRIQYYRVEILWSDTPDGQIGPDQRWAAPARDAPPEVTFSSPLYIKARKLDYAALAGEITKWKDPFSAALQVLESLRSKSLSLSGFLGLLGNLLFQWDASPKGDGWAAQKRQSMVSPNNAGVRFKFRDRGAVGTIAVWADPRDDDLLSISDLPREIDFYLDEKETPVNVVRVMILENIRLLRPPCVQRVRVVCDEPAGRLHIFVFTTEPYADTLRSLWRVHLGTAECKGATLDKTSHSLSLSWQDDFVKVPGRTLLEEERNFATARYAEKQLPLATLRAFTAAGRHTLGSSVWFEDIIGKLAISEQIVFETPLARPYVPVTVGPHP